MSAKKGFLHRVSRAELGSNAQTMTYVELAEHYGVSQGSISYALRRLGLQKGRQRSEPPTPLPPSESLALLIGAVLGDGNINQFPRCQRLLISFHSGQVDWIQEVSCLIHHLFDRKPSILSRSPEKCTVIQVYRQSITELLQLPAGDKIRNQVRFPEWIWSDPNYVWECLRGLFESDGTFAVNEENNVYFIEFKNHCDALLDDAETALRSLGLNPQRGPTYVRLARKDEIHIFVRATGFLKADLSIVPREPQWRNLRTGRHVRCALPGCDKVVYRKGAELRQKNYCSRAHADRARRKVTWPSREEIVDALSDGVPLVELGRRYGVSDNAVRKWIRSYGLPLHRRKAR